MRNYSTVFNRLLWIWYPNDSISLELKFRLHLLNEYLPIRRRVSPIIFHLNALQKNAVESNNERDTKIIDTHLTSLLLDHLFDTWTYKCTFYVRIRRLIVNKFTVFILHIELMHRLMNIVKLWKQRLCLISLGK